MYCVCVLGVYFCICTCIYVFVIRHRYVDVAFSFVLLFAIRRHLARLYILMGTEIWLYLTS